MSTSGPIPESIVEGGLQSIRAAGGRATPTKRLLLEALASNPGHRTADELTTLVQVQSPEVAASTIYRILEEFERIGLVEHNHSGTGPATYHLRSGAHGHLVCQSCGTTEEASPELFGELVEGARTAHGFIVDPHHFAVLGTCARCVEHLST
jgi:Fur family ferric uptake transcriptional regulator